MIRVFIVNINEIRTDCHYQVSKKELSKILYKEAAKTYFHFTGIILSIKKNFPQEISFRLNIFNSPLTDMIYLKSPSHILSDRTDLTFLLPRLRSEESH